MFGLLFLLKEEDGAARLHTVTDTRGNSHEGLMEKYNLLEDDGANSAMVIKAAEILKSMKLIEMCEVSIDKSTKGKKHYKFRLTDLGWSVADALPSRVRTSDDFLWNSYLWKACDAKVSSKLLTTLVDRGSKGFNSWGGSEELKDFVALKQSGGKRIWSISQDTRTALEVFERLGLIKVKDGRKGNGRIEISDHPNVMVTNQGRKMEAAMRGVAAANETPVRSKKARPSYISVQPEFR